MIKTPSNLVPYVDFDENEIICKDLPKELEKDFEVLKKLYESTKEDKLTDY